MKTSFSTTWFSRGTKISGCASILGSWQICHNLCLSLIGLLSTFAIVLQSMPLLFLNRFQWPFWIVAISLFGVLLLVRFKIKMACITNRGIIGNTGLLLAGFPLGNTLTQIAGLFIVIIVLVWYLASLTIKKENNQIVIDFQREGRKILTSLAGLVGVVFLLLILVRSPINTSASDTSHTLSAPRNKKMEFTLFDIAYAKNLMDKNNDGQCDVCGMTIEQCIASGMLECPMDPNSKIGLLGSQHIHAELKVYKNGKLLDLSFYKSLPK